MLDLFVNRSLYPAAPLQQRVALVTGSYDRTVDGVALTLNRLVGHLVQSGHEVLVLCPAASSSRPALVRHAGAPVQRVPSVPFPVWWEYRLTWGLGGAATRALAAFAPTVVHVAVQDAMGHAAQRWRRGGACRSSACTTRAGARTCRSTTRGRAAGRR